MLIAVLSGAVQVARRKNAGEHLADRDHVARTPQGVPQPEPQHLFLVAGRRMGDAGQRPEERRHRLLGAGIGQVPRAIARSVRPAARSSEALQNAARLEPHVESGQIYVTDDFMRHVEEDRGKQLPFDFVTLDADDLKNLTCKDGLFDIAKAGGEDPILTAIHRVDFR